MFLDSSITAGFWWSCWQPSLLVREEPGFRLVSRTADCCELVRNTPASPVKSRRGDACRDLLAPASAPRQRLQWQQQTVGRSLVQIALLGKRSTEMEADCSHWGEVAADSWGVHVCKCVPSLVQKGRRHPRIECRETARWTDYLWKVNLVENIAGMPVTIKDSDGFSKTRAKQQSVARSLVWSWERGRHQLTEKDCVVSPHRSINDSTSLHMCSAVVH